MVHVVKRAVSQSKRDVVHAVIQVQGTVVEFVSAVIVKKFIATIFLLVLYRLLTFKLMVNGGLGVISRNAQHHAAVDFDCDKESVMIQLHSK